MEQKTINETGVVVDGAASVNLEGELLEGEDIANVSLLDNFRNPQPDFFSTVIDDGKASTRKIIYNSLAAPDCSVNDMVGKQIELVDVIAYPVTFLQEGDRGDEVTCLRTVLIDKNGKSYAAVSEGIANSVMRLFTIYGTPHWEEPIKVEIRQVKTRNGNNKINILTAV